MRVNRIAQTPEQLEVKCYLEQVRGADVRIEAKCRDIERIEEKIAKCTTVFSTDLPSGEHNPHSTSDSIIKMENLREELHEDIDCYTEAIRSAGEAIESLGNPLYVQILHRRYMEFQTFEQIAVSLNMSYRHIQRLHDMALSELVGSI